MNLGIDSHSDADVDTYISECSRIGPVVSSYTEHWHYIFIDVCCRLFSCIHDLCVVYDMNQLKGTSGGLVDLKSCKQPHPYPKFSSLQPETHILPSLNLSFRRLKRSFSSENTIAQVGLSLLDSLDDLDGCNHSWAWKTSEI